MESKTEDSRNLTAKGKWEICKEGGIRSAVILLFAGCSAFWIMAIAIVTIVISFNLDMISLLVAVNSFVVGCVLLIYAVIIKELDGG